MSRDEPAWRFDPQGDPRGYIQPKRLKGLWFHTGMRCSFCLEGTRPGDDRLNPIITKSCMTAYKTEAERDQMMCSLLSKMVVKKSGRMRVYACTLEDDDEGFDLGDSLSEAMDIRVILKHHRCYSCFANGISCSEL